MIHAYTSDKERIALLKGRKMQVMTPLDLETKISQNKTKGCCIVLNLSCHPPAIIRAERAGMLLFLNSTPSLEDLKKIVVNPFYLILVRCYGRAAQEILLAENYEYLAQENTSYEITCPVILPNGECVLLKRVSEPFILVQGDGQECFASLDTFEIIGKHKGDYLHVEPMIKKDGIPLAQATKYLIAMATPYIFKHLPLLTSRELDVLEELVANQNSVEIGQVLGMSFNTVEEHRQNIRKKAQIISADLNDVRLAKKLRNLGMY